MKVFFIFQLLLAAIRLFITSMLAVALSRIWKAIKKVRVTLHSTQGGDKDEVYLEEFDAQLSKNLWFFILNLVVMVLNTVSWLSFTYYIGQASQDDDFDSSQS